MKNLSGYINTIFKSANSGHDLEEKEEEEELLMGCSTGESGSWDIICCLTVNLYNNQLILHIQNMHALPVPSPTKAPFPEDDTVQKTISFSVCDFSRNKAVHVDYFDFEVCLVMPFLFQNTGRDVQWLQRCIGHNGILTVADQNLTAFKS